MKIVPLSAKHDRKEFDCGVDDMNRYLREQARHDTEKDLSRTFVSLGEDDTHITGHYTLALAFLEFENIPQEKRLSRYPAPVALLARLAVDKQSQGQRLGERLLFDAQTRVLELSRSIGIYAMTLDARDESLCAFYAQYDFKSRADNPLRMYKTLSAIRKLNLVTDPLSEGNEPT
jgi:predicted N-acetyltransferase YhbS